MKNIETHSLYDLPNAAEQIIEHCPDGGVVAFYGEMGAGKTTLIREICASLGVSDTVTSPTFAIINQYQAADGRTIYHFDFYRINTLEEAFDLGYDEYFDSGALCLVEWPEKIEPLLPAETTNVTITITGPSSRLITIEQPAFDQH